MKTANFIEKDQNWQNETTVYWFELDGETWGVSDCNGERTIVDCDGCTVSMSDAKNAHLTAALVITEEMELDR